jgi:hypothetical protein
VKTLCSGLAESSGSSFTIPVSCSASSSARRDSRR